MKLVRYRKKSIKFDKIGTIGMDSFCNLFDGIIWNHADTINENIDYVFLMGDDRTLNWYKENGRPKGWEKVLYVLPSCAYQAVTNGLIENVINADVDGYYVYGHDFNNIFKLIGKPIIKGNLPYEFIQPNIKPKKDKAILIIKNLSDAKINYMATLYVFKELGIEGVVTLNMAGPYIADLPLLRRLVKIYGLDDRLEVIEPIPDRKEFLEYISDCKIMINMDIRIGINRNVIDAMETGMYCIGAYSPYQEMFYNDFMVEGYQLQKAINKCKEALLLPPYKIGNIDVISYDTIKEKLLKDLKKI